MKSQEIMSYIMTGRENIAKLMPHLELEIELETTTGNLYSEKIKCGSG